MQDAADFFWFNTDCVLLEICPYENEIDCKSIASSSYWHAN